MVYSKYYSNKQTKQSNKRIKNQTTIKKQNIILKYLFQNNPNSSQTLVTFQPFLSQKKPYNIFIYM